MSMPEKDVFAEDPKRRKKTVAHTIGAISSLIRSQPRRIAWDEVDIVDLGRLAGLRVVLEDSIGEMARGLNANGYSWAEIARVLNVTKQEAHRRYGATALARRTEMYEDPNGEPIPTVTCEVCGERMHIDCDYHVGMDGETYCPEHCPSCSEGHTS